jgi:uncharacterized coiled-coil protein SlyX
MDSFCGDCDHRCDFPNSECTHVEELEDTIDAQKKEIQRLNKELVDAKIREITIKTRMYILAEKLEMNK